MNVHVSYYLMQIILLCIESDKPKLEKVSVYLCRQSIRSLNYRLISEKDFSLRNSQMLRK
jgi:hypothetical protein